MNGIGAVIVAYNPDPEHFREVIAAVRPQVEHLVIVNNGGPLPANVDGSFESIECDGNIGIAAALNRGIARLLELGCRWLLLLDHDSVAPPGMVAGLQQALQQSGTGGDLAVAVGPAYYNAPMGRNAPFVRFGWLRLNYVEASADAPVIPVDFLISSGTLLTADAIARVGWMDESLFIDYVDTEWCMRATSKGYRLLGCGSVDMRHSLGDEPVEFLNKVMPGHSPLRHYYIIRNAVLVAIRRYIPLKLKCIILLSMTKTFLFYSVAPPDRGAHFRMMCKGLLHGLLGKGGPLPNRIQRQPISPASDRS